MTNNQKKLLFFISAYRLKYGHSPTLQEMVTGIQVSDNKSVLGIISALIDKGYLCKTDKKLRSVFLTDKGLSFLKVPIFQRNSFRGSLSQYSNYSKNTVSVSSPSHILGSNDSIVSDGSSIGIEDIDSVVKSAVNTAIDKYFNGTGVLSTKSIDQLILNCGRIISSSFKEKNISTNLSWATILIFLTWANLMLIKNVQIALIYSIVSAIIIKFFLK